jgi:hypothetical protein
MAFEIGKRDEKWLAVELQRHTQALAQENVEAPEWSSGSDPVGAANASPCAAHVYEQEVVKPPALERGTRARGQSSGSLVEVHNCAFHGDDRKAKVLQCDILHSVGQLLPATAATLLSRAERLLDSTEYEMDRDSRQSEAHDSTIGRPPSRKLANPQSHAHLLRQNLDVARAQANLAMARHIHRDPIPQRPGGWSANPGNLNNGACLADDPRYARPQHSGLTTGYAVIDIGHSRLSFALATRGATIP